MIKPGDEIKVSDPIAVTDDGREVVWVRVKEGGSFLAYRSGDKVYLPSVNKTYKTILPKEKP